MSAQSQTDICESLCVSECDVSLLMESLVEVSDKWEEIGITLGLPSHIRYDCRGRNNTLSLTNVLCEWINVTESTEETTLKILKLALENPLVDRRRVAKLMVERFTAAKRPSAKKPLAAKTPPLAAKRQCLDYEVLAKNQQLVDFYSVRKEIPADSWPPTGTATFINLAVIKKNKRGTGNYNFSVRGDTDDILASKDKIEYDEVFGQYQSRTLVLVEGRPGSGKTTLVHKVNRDWATTENMLTNANMVFLIPLRSLAKGHDESLTDILAIFYWDKEDREIVVSDIRRSNGEGVCFIFDGLDEYQPKNERNSVISALIQKTYLPNAMVIVTSRPVATATLRDEAPVTKRIEVLGFTHKQIFEYIAKFPFTADVSNLRAYLNSHRNILHMCYLPMHASMICYLFEHEKGHIPPTETKIYEHFTRYLLLRKLRRTNKKAILRSLEDLCGETKEYFRKVCHLALDMTIHSKQVVNQCDTNVLLSHDAGPDDAPSLGLITIDSTALQYGVDDTYTFLHLTFQEYLAALYIAMLEGKEQTEVVTLHVGQKHMMNVWKFYCGMVNFEGKVTQIEQIMRSASPLYRVQCAFESQQAVICDHAILMEAGVLSFSNITLSPADLTSLGYVISKTSHPVTRLAMAGCDLDDDHVTVFLREVSNNKLNCIQTLNLSWNKIGPVGAAALAEVLKLCNNLQALHLYSNSIGADGAASLAEALKSCNTLQTLDLGVNKIGAKGVAALSVALKSCNHLQTLLLYENNIGAEGVVALAEALKSCNNLQTLHLYNNDIGADGAVALAEALKSCNSLETLHLMVNNIGDHGATALAEALRSCNNLQTLYLLDNNIGDDGAAALADLKSRLHHCLY